MSILENISHESKPKVFIGVCYHKIAPVIKTDCLVPIQVGRVNAQAIIPGMIGDDTGRNISHKNSSWCELTAAYWMRYNVEADYYGLMHYRRLLNFSAQKGEGVKTFEFATPREYKKFGWNDNSIINSCRGADIITAPVWDVYPVGSPHKPMTNLEMYAREHFSKDMEVVENIVSKNFPEFYPYLIRTLMSNQCFFGNIAIMRKSLFFDYCDIIFPLLEEAESQIDIGGYDSYQRRIWGFIAERLVNAYVGYAHNKYKARVKTLPLVTGLHMRAAVQRKMLIDDAQARRVAFRSNDRSIKAPAGGEFINIVMALDDNYAPHAAVTVKSCLELTKKPEEIRFFVLESGGINDKNKDQLRAMARTYGADLLFVSVLETELSWLPLNRNYISSATYYRLLMDRVLPVDVNKVIYLDSDVIVNEPIEHLWSIELGNNLVAGCPDEGGVLQSRRLQLPSSHRYFNAGVLVFNIEQIRHFDLFNKVLKVFRNHGDYITLQDQDILNIVFLGRVLSLPLKWNVGNRVYNSNELEPAYSADEAQDAAVSPAIVHFTDKIKPWNIRSSNPFTSLYWDYRNGTYWKETFAAKLHRKIATKLRFMIFARQRRVLLAEKLALQHLSDRRSLNHSSLPMVDAHNSQSLAGQ